MSKYRTLFIEESREHLAELSRLLVALENTSDPAPLIANIFRRVHSIKGMAASMSYEPVAALAHGLEDVVDRHRQQRLPVEATTVDVLLRAVDALTRQVDCVTRDEPILEYVDLLRDLGGLLARVEPSPVPPASALPQVLPSSGGVDSARVVRRVRVELAPATQSPAVRLFLAYRQLCKVAEVVEAEPGVDVLRRGGWSGQEGEFSLVSDRDDDSIMSLLRSLPDIRGVRWVSSGPGMVSPTVAPEVAAPAAARAVAEATSDPDRTGAGTVRVRTDVLDNLMDNIGELYILRQRLESLLTDSASPELQGALDALSACIREVHSQVMTVRMTKMRTLTDRYPRLVRDLARSLGKDVEVAVEGTEIELDRAIIESLDEPIVHILRNAVDHGLESTADRTRLGKSTVGKIRISAVRDRDTAVVVIEDDGRGLDADSLRQRAVELNLLGEKQAAVMGVRESLFLICLPGFSTKREVSGVSGRGVGMDAVRSKIESLGGTLDIEAEKGLNTRFILRLPITVAIINVLLVEVCGRPFAVPVAKVVAVRDTGGATLQEANGRVYLCFRDELVPLVRLPDVLGFRSDGMPEQAVVIEDNRDLIAVAVERILGYREVVVKPLGDPLARLEWLSGATILGDGQPILILDLPKAVRARMAA